MPEGAIPHRRDRLRLPAADRRLMIVEATAEVIAERGFWGLSLQDVADRCGLTVPGVLRHVGSKSGLLLALLSHRDQEDARSLRTQLGVGQELVPDDWAEGGPQGVDLRRLCSATMRRNAEQPGIVQLFTVLQAESLAPGHPAHAYFVQRQQRAAAAFAALAADVSEQPETLALHIMATMDGLQLHWLRSPDSIDLVAEWETAAEALFARRAYR
ncbi:TetR/AcrR family transcriptional regulator [Streptacidiphilus sp. 4-A2]|nr:TetR/AcrR family transcriptional regulator [Streptacidiphilus sp. 4-A2]